MTSNNEPSFYNDAYEDEFQTKKENSCRFIFKKRCKYCGTKMKLVGFEEVVSDEVYWCPKCGTLIAVNRFCKIANSEWMPPQKVYAYDK